MVLPARRFVCLYSGDITDFGHANRRDDNNDKGAGCSYELGVLVTPMRKNGDKIRGGDVGADTRAAPVSLLPFAGHVAQVNVNCHFISLRRLMF